MKKLIIIGALAFMMFAVFSPTSAYAFDDTTRLPEFEEEVQSILSCIDTSMSDVEKALAVHEYFLNNYHYGRYTHEYTTDPGEAYTAYGIMVNKFGVCEAYTQAYKYIMERLGIPCINVTSTAMDHSWNMVSIDGDWYHVDVTFDDSGDSHKHFLRSDTGIAASGHYGWDGDKTAGSTKYDNAFWTNIESSLHYINGYWYYVDRGNISSRIQDGFTITDHSNISDVGLIKQYSFDTDTHKTIYKVSSQNYSYKDDGRSYQVKWKGGYTSIASDNGRLYYNTNNKVFSINADGKDTKLVCTVTPAEYPMSDTVGKAYIEEIEIVNGTIYYNSSEYSDTYVAAVLPTAAPIHTITSKAATGGKITPSGDIKINHNKSRTFIVTPASGLQTVDVLIDGVSMGPLSEYTFTNVSSDHSIQATFAGAGGEWQLTLIDGEYKNEYSFKIHSFSEGLAAVENYELGTRGFINTSGKTVIPLSNKYESMSPFTNGVSLVRSNGKYGLINTSGSLVVPCIYNIIGAFSEGLAEVEKDGRFGFINASGKLVIPCIYENIRGFKNGVAWVFKDGKSLFIDTSGNTVSTYVSEEEYFRRDGLNQLCLGSKWGYTNTKGEIVVPCIYEQIGEFNDGMAYVYQNGKYGFVNTSGELAVPFIYDKVGNFSEGLAYVCQNGKYGFINKAGVLVVPCIYEAAGEFSEGLAYVSQIGEYSITKYGYINTAGELVIPCIYKYASDFSEGIAPVILDEKWGILKRS